ncbi:hypothetical protein [Mycolicibacter minnesotensis]|nr:hypothetical protein [Mycolicibacter minnesotensis]
MPPTPGAPSIGLEPSAADMMVGESEPVAAADPALPPLPKSHPALPPLPL